MNRRSISIFLFFLILIPYFSYAQNNDSLWAIYNNKAQPDTLRWKAIHKVSKSYLFNNPDTALIILQKELQLAKETKQKEHEAATLNLIGVSYELKGDYSKTLAFFKLSLNKYKELGLKEDIASSLDNIGIVYLDLSDFPQALDYSFQSLKILETLGDSKDKADCLINIANIFRNLSDYPKALKYDSLSLKIYEKFDDKKGMSAALGSMGNIYSGLSDNAKALDYNLQSLKMIEKTDNKRSIAISLNNVGSIYAALYNYPEALIYEFRGLKLGEEIGNKSTKATSLGNIGSIYIKQKQFAAAFKYLLKAMELTRELGDLNHEKFIQSDLYEGYKATGNSEQALVHYERFILLKDSIFKEENQKQIIRKEINYEFEKKEAIAKLKEEKKEAILNEEKKKQKAILFSVIIGLIIVVAFSIFLYNRIRITRRQKSIIEKQKHLVDEANESLNQQNEEISAQRDEIEIQKQLIEEHQKETIDSITYAKHIQDAILPPIDLILEKLPNTFVLYKPKDIVAGDFYWMEEIDDLILIAAADCTGHGVPGAMVSVVCSNALNRAVKEFHLSDTGAILDKVTDLVIETFEKSSTEVKDGMDISMLSINKVTRQIQWSGANNPLWYFDNGELTVITADKQPIGKSDHRKPFTTHTIEYKPNTTFYLFTDGYADQFGGPKGKKFMQKEFQKALYAMLNKEPIIQETTLIKVFENWKGELDQVDDVCVIGIRL